MSSSLFLSCRIYAIINSFSTSVYFETLLINCGCICYNSLYTSVYASEMNITGTLPPLLLMAKS